MSQIKIYANEKDVVNILSLVKQQKDAVEVLYKQVTQPRKNIEEDLAWLNKTEKKLLKIYKKIQLKKEVDND